MADADLSGTVLDGRYQVIEPIAEGAMGCVYRGERLKLGRAVAIKIMHQELPDELASRQRFEREAKLMALLEHPNCVSVIDFGVHDDKPFLVMDLVRGTSLLDTIEKTGRLDIARASEILKQVLSGLAHAHELGIVHRDIKPANIMLSEKAGLGMQVRILDFGLARLTESSTKLTTGIVVGTPNYMSPEQCKGGDIDARTDLYACGVMLFEMLTGRKPFVADDPIAVVRKHLLEKPPTLAAVEPNVNFGALEDVVAKALAKSPADRYDSAVEMTKALDAAAQSVLKTNAAALYARAIPESAAPPIANQQATMSGWAVPQTDAGVAASSSGVPGASSGVSGASSGVPGVSTSSTNDSFAPPVTESQFVDAIVPPPGSPLARPSGSPLAPPPTPQANESAPPVTESQFVDAIVPPPGSPLAPSSSAASGPTSSSPLAPSSATPSGPTSAPSLSPSSAALSGPTSAPSLSPPPAASSAAPSGSPFAPTNATASGSVSVSESQVVGSAAASGSLSSGAPNRSMSVPPTRPAQAPRVPGQLPVSKKQLMIGGGVLAAVILIIAIVAGSGGKKTTKPIAKAPVEDGIEIHDSDPVGPTIDRANQLLASDDPEAAVTLLSKARKAKPDNAQLALALGRAYFGKLWWSEGVRNFRDAIRLDPSLKSDPEMLKAVLKGFLTTPDIDDRIEDFMFEIGDPMKPYLQETADKHPNKQLRARAKAELRRFK